MGGAGAQHLLPQALSVFYYLSESTLFPRQEEKWMQDFRSRALPPASVIQEKAAKDTTDPSLGWHRLGH